MSVIHNDANDHNVLVDEAGDRIVGLLDLGDIVWSVTAHEAAVAAAYAMFDRADPLAVLGTIVAGFDRTCRLTDDELDALPDLVLARVATSVSIAARQTRLDPDPYLRDLRDTGLDAPRASRGAAPGSARGRDRAMRSADEHRTTSSRAGGPGSVRRSRSATGRR